MEEANFLYDQVETKYVRSLFYVLRKSLLIIKKAMNTKYTKSEIVYLTIHIQRLLTQGQKL